MSGGAFSDEELVAYLDAALPPGRQAALEAARAEDAGLRARLAALDVDLAAVRAAFDLHLAAAPSEALRRRLADAGGAAVVASRRGGRWLQVAAAVLVGVGLGYGGARLGVSDAPADWHATVAEYQSLYTTDTLKPLGGDAGLVRQEVAAAAAALGRGLTIPALQVGGLELKRAQVLAFRGRPLVQFAYLDAAGTPIAFCATRSDQPDAMVQATVLDGLATAFWNKGGFGYMVIGGRRTAAVEGIARVLEPRT